MGSNHFWQVTCGSLDFSPTYVTIPSSYTTRTAAVSGRPHSGLEADTLIMKLFILTSSNMEMGSIYVEKHGKLPAL